MQRRIFILTMEPFWHVYISNVKMFYQSRIQNELCLISHHLMFTFFKLTDQDVIFSTAFVFPDVFLMHQGLTLNRICMCPLPFISLHRVRRKRTTENKRQHDSPAWQTVSLQLLIITLSFCLNSNYQKFIFGLNDLRLELKLPFFL